MSETEFEKNFNEYCESDSITTNQIFINSQICNKKHLFLKTGIYGLIPFGISMLFFIVANSLVFI